MRLIHREAVAARSDHIQNPTKLAAQAWLLEKLNALPWFPAEVDRRVRVSPVDAAVHHVITSPRNIFQIATEVIRWTLLIDIAFIRISVPCLAAVAAFCLPPFVLISCFYDVNSSIITNAGTSNSSSRLQSRQSDHTP